MLSSLSRLNLIRYLIVWRVNSSLAFFPRYLSIDLSKVIGTIISRRLPSKEQSTWEKSLDKLILEPKKSSKDKQKPFIKIPDVSWPINSVLLPYPCKRTYGRDELIFWELKLFGEHADHGLFLEVILPAMEEASYTADTQLNRRNRLWGHFDIKNIFVARGPKWEPLVTDGKLDLRYSVNPMQWLEGLTFNPKQRRNFKLLDWITPCDLTDYITPFFELDLPDEKEKLKFTKSPPLSLILLSFVYRLNDLLRENSKSTARKDEILNSEDRSDFHYAFQQTLNITPFKNILKKLPPSFPGKWMGTQEFTSIPKPVIPYLEAASILHIGKQTHFGCGTFLIK